MSVTCTEDLPFVDVEKERGLAAGTLVGSYRLDQQMAACDNVSRNAGLAVAGRSSAPDCRWADRYA